MILKYFFFAVAFIALAEVSANKSDKLNFLTTRFGLKRVDPECTKEGYSCETPEKSNFCLDLGGTIIEDTEECKSPETCIEATGQCGVEEAKYKFECHQTGTFPHAFDCRKYNLCLLDEDGKLVKEPKEMDCEDGLSYDSRTTLCIHKLEVAEKCTSIVGRCNRVGQQGPVLNNPNMYYICLNTENVVDPDAVPDPEVEMLLFPQFLNCKGGQQFVDGKCQDVSISSGLDGDDICILEGNFYSETNCKAVNVCTVGVKPVEMNCPVNQYFDKRSNACRVMDCS